MVRLFDYTGLYVADGSIVPTALGTNPTATIEALAEMIAQDQRDPAGLQVGHFVHALADLEGRVVRQGRPVTPKRIQLFVNDLLNTAIGALTAPVSPATTVLLRLS